jgi:flagellar secretion chaperone FliS
MNDARSRYMADAVATAGPARLLTMLYDRMLLDLDRAVEALNAGDRGAGTGHLVHAQEIVAELIASLDETAWNGGPQLMSIYRFLLSELIESGARGDAERVLACRALVEPLGKAWHDAAASVGRAQVPTQATPSATETTGPVGLLGVG